MLPMTVLLEYFNLLHVISNPSATILPISPAFCSLI